MIQFTMSPKKISCVSPLGHPINERDKASLYYVIGAGESRNLYIRASAVTS